MLAKALRCGVTVLDYWDMTPKETVAVIEASAWNYEQDQKDLAWLAWHIAALSRVKKLPPLSALFGGKSAKKLEGDELEKRREEFRELKEKSSKWVKKLN